MGAGILASRLAGLVRQRVLAHYLGLSGSADAFAAAFRIPNFLQNLLGEGALSASFIPVYARLVAARDMEAARRVAGAVGALLALVLSVLVLGGMLASPVLVDVIAPGFTGERRDLAVSLVRLFFPGAGLLVLSAWCLGVLNAHHRFLLSYSAPVVWNLAIIGALVLWPAEDPARAALIAAWGAVVGSALQVLVQWPAVRRSAGPIRFRVRDAGPDVREVARTFGPALLGRGVIQISAWVDTLLATFLPVGAVMAMMNAQTLYLLPVSLFGMSIAAAELPSMAADRDRADQAEALGQRLTEGWRRLLLVIIPSTVLLLGFGGDLVAALFQTGAFRAADSEYVWMILAGAAVGLLPATAGRLWASAFYARGDTRTPLRGAVIRVGTGIVLGSVGAILLPGWVGLDPKWGAAFLAGAGAVAAWIEFGILRRRLAPVIGHVAWSPELVLRLTLVAAAALLMARGAATLVGPGAWPRALIGTGVFGSVYLGLASLLGVQGARDILAALRIPFRRRPPGGSAPRDG